MDPVELHDGWADSCPSSPRGANPAQGAAEAKRDAAADDKFSRLSWKLQAILESHRASLERSMSEQHRQSSDQLSAILKQIRSVSEVASRLHGFHAGLDALQQELSRRMEQSLPREGTLSKGTLALIAEECAGKLQPQQREQLAQIRGMQGKLDEMEAAIQKQAQAAPVWHVTTVPAPPAQPPARDPKGSPAVQDASDEDSADPPGEPLLHEQDLKVVRGETEALKRAYEALEMQRSRPTSRTERAKTIVDRFSTGLILANAVWMAVEVELGMQAVRAGKAAPQWLCHTSILFVVAFGLEMLLKLALHRRAFFAGPGGVWNILDAVLVVLQAAGLALSTASNFSFVRLLWGCRAVCVARSIRTTRVARELRLLAAAVAHSAGTLLWASLILAAAIFLCALGVQQTVQSSLERNGLGDTHLDLLNFYGTLFDTMLSLLMALSGGADWRRLVEPLEQISEAYLVFFVLFTVAGTSGALSVLAAALGGATWKIAEVDAALAAQGRLERESSAVGRLRDLLEEADRERTGAVGREDVEACLEDPRFQAQLRVLDLSRAEVLSVFEPPDGGGQSRGDGQDVPVEELVYGLIRLRGSARARDAASMLRESRRLVARLAPFVKLLGENIREAHPATCLPPTPSGLGEGGQSPATRRGIGDACEALSGPPSPRSWGRADSCEGASGPFSL